MLFSTKKFSVAFRGKGGKGGGVAWSSKKLHPKNDPTLRPGHSKPVPQLQTTASRFAYSNFGEDARGTHGRGSLLHRASVGRHGQIRDGQRLSPFRVLPRGPAKGLTEHRIRATVHPSPAAVTPGGSTPTWAMYYKRTIGRTRERATHTRLMRLARGVGARVPCDRATVQATVQSATTAGCSHSRWVDPHVSYVQAHHRSDPRAG